MLLLRLAATSCQANAPARPAVPPAAAEAPAPSVPAVGVAAPGFTLQTLEGEPFSLADGRGKIVVLNFWASWCGPCRDEMPLFESVSHEGDDVLFVGVNATASDDREAAADFVRRLEITFPIVLDESGDVAAAYGVTGLPATFFIDRDGILRARALGPVLNDRLREHLALARAP